jgi:hypothetical protein
MWGASVLIVTVFLFIAIPNVLSRIPATRGQELTIMRHPMNSFPVKVNLKSSSTPSLRVNKTVSSASFEAEAFPDAILVNLSRATPDPAADKSWYRYHVVFPDGDAGRFANSSQFGDNSTHLDEMKYVRFTCNGTRKAFLFSDLPSTNLFRGIRCQVAAVSRVVMRQHAWDAVVTLKLAADRVLELCDHEEMPVRFSESTVLTEVPLGESEQDLVHGYDHEHQQRLPYDYANAHWDPMLKEKDAAFPFNTLLMEDLHRFNDLPDQLAVWAHPELKFPPQVSVADRAYRPFRTLLLSMEFARCGFLPEDLSHRSTDALYLQEAVAKHTAELENLMHLEQMLDVHQMVTQLPDAFGPYHRMSSVRIINAYPLSTLKYKATLLRSAESDDVNGRGGSCAYWDPQMSCVLHDYAIFLCGEMHTKLNASFAC